MRPFEKDSLWLATLLSRLIKDDSLLAGDDIRCDFL